MSTSVVGKRAQKAEGGGSPPKSPESDQNHQIRHRDLKKRWLHRLSSNSDLCGPESGQICSGGPPFDKRSSKFSEHQEPAPLGTTKSGFATSSSADRTDSHRNPRSRILPDCCAPPPSGFEPMFLTAPFGCTPPRAGTPHKSALFFSDMPRARPEHVNTWFMPVKARERAAP